MKKHICTIWVVIIYNLCYGQHNFTSYNSSNGLPHDLTYGLHQDDTGIIWMGTDAGLVRYNGKDFDLLTLTEGLRSNYVIDIKPIGAHKKIIATWGGGLHILDEENRIHRLTIEDSLSKLTNVIPFKNDFICKFFGDRFFYYKKVNKSYLPMQLSLYKDFGILSSKNRTNDIRPDIKFKKISERVFAYDINRTGNPMYEIHNNTSVTEVFSFLKKYDLCDFGLYRPGVLFGLTKKKLLLFTEKDGVIDEILYDDNHLPFLRFYKKDHLEVFLVKAANDTQQLLVVDNTTKKTFVVDEKALKFKKISDILIDRDYNIWVSTYGNGILKIQRETCSPFIELFKEKMFLDVVEDDTYFYLLSQDKICMMDPKLSSLECIPIPESYDIAKRKDQILIFNKKLIEKDTFHFNGKLFRLTEDYHLISHQKDSIFHNANTLKIRRNGKTTLLLSEVQKEEYKNIDINDVEVFSGHLWCASNLGIFVFNIKTYALEKRITTANGLSHNLVIDLEVDGNTIWAATINGLDQINDNHITPFDKKWRTHSKQVNSLYKDKFGQLWLGTQCGLSMYNGQELYHFDEKNGLSSSSVMKIKTDTQDRLWIIGNNGIDILENQSKFSPCTSGKLMITQSQSKFDIELVDYSGRFNLIEYSLNNTTWKEVSDKNLDFKNYQYDRYSIVFRTRKPDSNWTYSNTYNFAITRPWYKSWFFITSIIMLLVLLGSFFVHHRLKKLKERNMMLKRTINQSESLKRELDHARENIAKDFHDELGNKIAGIVLLSELAAQEVRIKNQPQLFKRLQRIQEDASSLYTGIKDFIWSIDHKSDNLQELIYYLKDFGEDLFSHNNINFFVYADIDYLSIKLPYYWSKHLLLIFKEAMTNTLKHSKANRVEFKVEFNGNNLCMILSDNGKGFDQKKIKRTYGLVNMKKRAVLIGVKISIESKNGTRIILNGVIP
ncbi:sensor histidine kinase [Flavivirga algicola]|uniref:histidine kinase n=1 Tax=Flavivirga algicola TaxID=2729136 RepID=A0ABX1RZH9_9FLAO|nr:two-component regulator propeller domain-containing protein [Flavivirga algicola]NMH88982.1 hypothetical protein [Flavivirga algicola]